MDTFPARTDSGFMRFKKILCNLCLSLVAILLCIIFLEIVLKAYNGIRGFFDTSRSRTVPMHIVSNTPVLYGLNPEYPGINSYGLRDDEVAIPKPEGTFRILVLGDSVAYGAAVSSDRTFPNRLEGLLRKQYKSVDVINSGVWGYTAYNELQYYLTKGRAFEPDIVMVAFCMNDVANPRLHWGNNKEIKFNIPEEAIPNHEFDLNYVQPKVKRQKFIRLLQYSDLYKALEWRFESISRNIVKNNPNVTSELQINLAGEDPLSIEVLLDESSPEWRWLSSIYDKLHKAVKEDQAKLIIVIFPLAYQLDNDYPFLPQKNFAEYCRKNSILCIDLLTSFRQHSKEDIFLLNKSGYYDVWHLADYGHKLSAQEIAHFIRENNLDANSTIQIK
jgi:hypothetical protein